jgi:ketosteroid isomerase-like protein
VAVDARPARDDVGSVLAAERALYAAQVAGNVEAIAAMLDAGLVYIHSTGVAEGKSAYLAGVRGGLYEYGRIESRDTRVDVVGDTAFVSGLVDMTVGARGGPKALIHLLFCLRWTRDGAQWRLAYRQGTRVAA